MKVLFKRVLVLLIWPIIVGLLGLLHPPLMLYLVFAMVSGAIWGIAISLLVWPNIK